MNPQIIDLTNIEPARLDSFLSLGWFRIRQTIFTTNYLYFDGQEYDAIWLRVNLDDFTADKNYKKLFTKNGHFRTEIKRAIVTAEHEQLYNSYKESISFEGAQSLHSLLYGKSDLNVYNTWMIEIYDDTAFIGSGCFDLGSNSAAGIFSVYDPRYKKFSLGKYMIYEKMLFCKKQNLTFFYPGYFAPGYPVFDYKLEIGKEALEYFDAEQKKWYSFYNNGAGFFNALTSSQSS